MAKKKEDSPKQTSARDEKGRFAKKPLATAVSSVVSSEPMKQEEKKESSDTLLQYLQENFPIINSLIKDLNQSLNSSNEKILYPYASINSVSTSLCKSFL